MPPLFADQLVPPDAAAPAPPRSSARQRKPDRLHPFRPHPRGQLVLDLPGVPIDGADIRVGYTVAFTRDPSRGRFEVLEVGPNLVTVRGRSGKPIEVRRKKLRAV